MKLPDMSEISHGGTFPFINLLSNYRKTSVYLILTLPRTSKSNQA